MRKEIEGEEFHDYMHTVSNQHNAKISINPPSETLYLTFAKPCQEDELRKLCEDISCPIMKIEWKSSEGKKDKWMCLAQF